MEIAEFRVSDRGQMALPAEARHRWHLDQGGSVEIAGTATSPAFLYYKVEYSTDGDQWYPVDGDNYRHEEQVSGYWTGGRDRTRTYEPRGCETRALTN